MRLTVLGGGGVRSAFLARSLTYNAHRIGLTEVVFLDNSTDNLAIFGKIARYIFNTTRPDIQLSTTTDPVVALQGTNYIITTLRVGDDENRIRDKHIALQHNTLGRETTGAGSFAMAMRSIPTILRYCRLIGGHTAEDTILFNLTDPSGLVTEAIIKSGFKRQVYGVCDTPSELIRELLATLGHEEHDLSVECYGLSHLSWFTHFTVHGEEVTERLIANPELCQRTAVQYFSPGLVQLCGNQFLNEYFYYYYYREVALKAIQEVDETRGEQIARISREMCEALRTVDARTQLEAAFTIWMQHYLCRENSYMQNESQQEEFHTHEPLTLHQLIEEPDTGGYAGMALDILEAVDNTTTKCIVIPIQSHDTLDSSHPDDAVEVNCDLSRDDLRPMTPVKVPTAQKNMISCVKEYKRLAVTTVLQQDRPLAMQALMTHLLIDSHSLVRILVEAYLDDEQFAAWQ